MGLLFLYANMAFAECDIEPNIIDDINPGDSVEFTRVNCPESESCEFKLNNAGGELADEEFDRVTYIAPSEVQCAAQVTITSDCPGTEMDQSVTFNVVSNSPCKISGGGCNSPGYGLFFIAPFLFRRQRQSKA